MLKNILKLNGAQELSKIEQKTINGGVPKCVIVCGAGGGVPCNNPTASYCYKGCVCY